MSSLRMLLRTLAVVGLSATLIAPASVARAEPTPAELTKQIEKSSTELERIVESYNKLNEEIKANKATAAKLQAQIGPLQAQAEQSRADVAALAATAYKSGGLRTTEALLEQGGASSLTERLGTLDQLTRQRQQTIDGFTANQRKLIDQKTRLDATLAREAAQARQLAAGKKKIETDLKRLYELRRQAYGRATEAPTRASSGGTAPAISGSAGVAVRYAYGAIGKPYVWGADGPDGYDCSGLTLASWRAAGKSLPHNAAMQWDATARVSRSSLQPGDLVFYEGLGHVAIYVGSGQVIDAPSAGRNVSKRDMDIMTIAGYGRVR
ncbi:glycoside hydrolase [Micromonospora globispora]|uniref:Glycoside hydrolase n=1 Tax=Micromonospora globispora TaxID=1450148 RepID=A0A317KBA3_9ACTN|nr:C40 family peptidase [Micromonospora globispora]PWU49381.1 glycoside hydrolase [Micromonospora globispora]PWU60862.1 glycoside hydrolase [Micromonospora globispora]RQX07506.1 glycoside hydrolase [Micromonospora globispora]